MRKNPAALPLRKHPLAKKLCMDRGYAKEFGRRVSLLRRAYRTFASGDSCLNRTLAQYDEFTGGEVSKTISAKYREALRERRELRVLDVGPSANVAESLKRKYPEMYLAGVGILTPKKGYLKNADAFRQTFVEKVDARNTEKFDVMLDVEGAILQSEWLGAPKTTLNSTLRLLAKGGRLVASVSRENIQKTKPLLDALKKAGKIDWRSGHAYGEHYLLFVEKKV